MLGPPSFHYLTRNAMFRIIGATVVYGLALYGLGCWVRDSNEVRDTR